jgi:hypothetical protein
MRETTMKKEPKTLKTGKGGTGAFIFVIFLSAFLLFQIQPIIARYILPWFGGSPSVWSSCLLFFQIGLVAGYAYAHFLVSVLRDRRHLQIGIHLFLVLLALISLPITPDPGMKPDLSNINPIAGILQLLTRTIGLPYVILSATGPLVQHWFSERFPNRSPFRLYAVSNAGSLLALLSYPFVVEVHFTVPSQSFFWSATFIVFLFALILTAVLFVKTQGIHHKQDQPNVFQAVVDPKAKNTHYFRWIAFSACGSILLLSLTSQMCQDVAVIPFLWVVPLSLYLLTFIIAFDHSRWYSRPFTIGASILALGMMIILMNNHFSSHDWSLKSQIAIYCSALFFSCLICHGEIVRLKPVAKLLTGFYLSISIGGALGGIFVNLIAPRIFVGYWELHTGLILLAALTSFQLLPSFLPFRRKTETDSSGNSSARAALRGAGATLWLAVMIGMILGLYTNLKKSREDVILASRGFFGVLKVKEQPLSNSDIFRALYHGRINHGLQFTDPDHQKVPTTYYHPRSGIGRTFEFLPQRRDPLKEPVHVGVIGLGIGTLATYAKPGDRFRFYEINSQVIDIANSHFTFLKNCEGKVEVILGDGRISLEKESNSGNQNEFDVLVVDAFSGDSIPMHLLTIEAFELYSEHLKEDGILALHVTNNHLDLSDPVRNLAKNLKMAPLGLEHAPKAGFASAWILLTKNRPFAYDLVKAGLVARWDRPQPREIHWSDDFSNLIKTLR